MDKKVKHLELIQNVISRMAGNSFMMKGWATVLFAGVCALANEENGDLILLGVCIPLTCFWGLDAYYLSRERLYRDLYEEVLKMNQDEIDFSLKITPKLHNKHNGVCSCFFSKTEAFFYLSLLVFIALVKIYLFFVFLF